MATMGGERIDLGISSWLQFWRSRELFGGFDDVAGFG
jgi:hypothetical protein